MTLHPILFGRKALVDGVGTWTQTETLDAVNWEGVDPDGRKRTRACPAITTTLNAPMEISGVAQDGELIITLSPMSVGPGEETTAYTCEISVEEETPNGVVRNAGTLQRTHVVRWGGIGQRTIPLEEGMHNRSVDDLALFYFLTGLEGCEGSDCPTILISGEQELFYWPADNPFDPTIGMGPNHRTLSVSAAPPGGQYSWTVEQGALAVSSTPLDNGRLLQVIPIAGSESQGDIVIAASYTVAGNPAVVDKIRMTSRTPKTTSVVGVNLTVDNLGEVYEHTYTYGIDDQFGARLSGVNFLLQERLTPLHDPYATVFHPEEWTSSLDGTYDDAYTLKFSGGIPNDYVARLRQEVWVQHVKVRDHVLVWGPNGVQLE